MFHSSPGTTRICGAIPRKPQNRACANCEKRDIYFRFRTNLTKALHGPPLVVYTISRAVHKVSRLFAKEAEGIGRSSLASRREGGSCGGYAARVSKARWDAAKRIRRSQCPPLIEGLLAVQLSRLFGIPERSVTSSLPVRNVVPTASVPPMGGFQRKG
jgi:hypothetical protein